MVCDVSTILFTYTVRVFIKAIDSCPTPATDLEQPYDDVNMRSRAYTEAVVADMDLKTLWQDYGIVGDLIVRISVLPCACADKIMPYSRSQTISHVQISMN